jgi:hypothetical protein
MTHRFTDELFCNLFIIFLTKSNKEIIFLPLNIHLITMNDAELYAGSSGAIFTNF